MKKKIIPLLLASSALIVACDQQAATNNSTASSTSAVATPSVKKEDAVAVVNGTYISKSSLATLAEEIAGRSHGQKFPKAQLLEELIQRELLVQDAKQKKLDQSPEIAERISMATRSLLSQAALQNYLKSNAVTDEEMKAEYDKEVTKSSGMEYKARHILVKEEAEAKKLIAELTKGAKFEELAKKHSTGPSGPQGGDLGWFVEGQMVEEFSKAVVALADSKFTTEPVKTQFGWHVILREEAREQTPPPFEAIKEQLRPALQQQKVQQMLEVLRKQAKVEILVSLEEPKAEAPKAEEPAVVAPVSIEDKAVEAVEKQAKEMDAAEAADVGEKTETPKAEVPVEKASEEKTAETK
ncbi:MAG: peptidylprolyl isomerase [Methylococcaceae bacterium]|nr:peptidylprolyl isomerase [Methylococcaceae bacterium]